jgi:ATP-dependent helicase/nuclease subunit A
MAWVDLSPEQRDAIYAPGNVLVRAGAGSGKTEVLARRFVALIAGDIAGGAPLSPERIAAITFTEKATADMRRRIAEVLDERIAGEQEADRRRSLKRARRMLGLARISTIHAFCARLLREHPLEAGVDPGFEVLDEHQSTTFLDRACREFVADAVRRHDPGAYRLAGARGLHGMARRPGAIQVLLRVIGEAARLGKSPRWISEKAASTASELRAYGPRIIELRASLVALVEKLAGTAGIGGQAGKKIDELRDVWPSLRHDIEFFGADSDPSALDRFYELKGALPTAQNARLRDTIYEIRGNAERDGIIPRIMGAYGACRAGDATEEIARLVTDVAVKLEARKSDARVVTFDDLLFLARRLLTEHPEIAQQYRRAISALLVDEYQDTDPIQDTVVRLLTEGDAPAPELFIVGDEKQSIYRFRGADVTVFNRPRALASLDERTLQENRRSLPVIVDFINAVGASVMAPHDGDDDRPYRVKWSEHHRLEATREAADVPVIELIVSPAPPRDDAKAAKRDLREVEANAVARHCGQMVAERVQVMDARSGAPRPIRFADIALLLRSFTDVALYEAGFARAGVPYYTVKGRGFYDCKEVRDLAALLGAIDDPRNSVDLAAALRSPLFGISDQCLLEIALHLEDERAPGGPRRPLWTVFDDPDEGFAWLGAGRDGDAARTAHRVLAELRAMRERDSLGAIVERALELTRFEAVMVGMANGRQRAANARKLGELARDFETHRFFGFADFVRHLRRLVAEPPREPQAPTAAEGDDVVRLMTIHQAKGLEFPVVIVPDLGRKPPTDNENVVITPDHGLLACDTVGAGDDALPNPLLAEWRKTVKDQEQAEAARILYVAMTRARDRLLLSEGPPGGEWQKQIRDVVGSQTVADFAGGGEDERVVEVAGVKVILRRAEALANQVGSSAQPATAMPSTAELAAMARARLGFLAPAARELVISPSMLEDFGRCPRQYFLRHELGIPGHDGSVPVGDGTGSAGAIGTVAHAVLEQLAPNLAAHTRETEIARSVELHSAGFEITPAERRALVRDLGRYAASPEFARGATASNVRREAPFFMCLEDDGFTLFVRGRIDLLIDEGPRIVVADYKYACPGAHDFRVQMECYALAAAQASAGRKVEAEIVYLRGGVERRALTLPPPVEMRAHLIALGRRIAAAGAAGEPSAYTKRPTSPAECRALGCGYVARCWRGERRSAMQSAGPGTALD